MDGEGGIDVDLPGAHVEFVAGGRGGRAGGEPTAVLGDGFTRGVVEDAPPPGTVGEDAVVVDLVLALRGRGEGERGRGSWAEVVGEERLALE